MTGVASVCALAAKHHHQLRVRQPELAVLKSAKAKAGNCNRKESLVRHHRRRQVDLARAEVTRLYHPKRQSFRIGSEGRITIPWKQPPKVRRRKQLDVRPRARWRWARVWLVPLRVVWRAVLLHRVPGVYILSPAYRPTNGFNRLQIYFSVLHLEPLYALLHLPALITSNHAHWWILETLGISSTTITVVELHITNKCLCTVRVCSTGMRCACNFF